MTSTPGPPPAEPAPTPAVPYGPGPGAPAGAASYSSGVTAKSAGRTAFKWLIRIALPIILRALFRALSRR